MTSNLPEIPLAEIVTIKGGKRLPAGKNLQSLPSKHPYIRIRDVGQRSLPRVGIEYVPDDVFPLISRYIVQKNDVVLSIVGTIGALSIVDGFYDQASLTENCVKLTGLDYHDALYIYYYLSSSIGQQEISQGTVGAVQPKLPIYNIEKIKVRWPANKDKRQIIASILGRLDDKIDLNCGINQTLEAMAQAIFKSWFIDFDPVKAKIAAIQEGYDPLRAAMSAISGKPDAKLDALPSEHFDQLAATAALFPDEMEDSKLGEIPRGWEVQRVGKMLELAYGKALKSTDRQEGVVPVYGSGGITGYHNTALVSNGSIVVGRKGTVGSLHWEDEPFFPIDTTYYARPLTAPLTYCYYAMQTLGLEKMNTDAAVPGLNRENVYRLELVRPDSPVLQKFDSTVLTLRKAIRTNSDSNKALASLRDTLLPNLLSGELSVTPTTELSSVMGGK